MAATKKVAQVRRRLFGRCGVPSQSRWIRKALMHNTGSSGNAGAECGRVVAQRDGQVKAGAGQICKAFGAGGRYIDGTFRHGAHGQRIHVRGRAGAG